MNDERNAGAAGVVLVLLGSNIDRQRNVPAAVDYLRRHPDWCVTAVSSIYESAAVGGSGEQPIFWNAAVCMKTGMTPSVLRNELRLIEAEMGRRRSADKFAPRPIDLDIALFDDLEIEIEGSHIPDPDIVRYAHVAMPLAEIAPNRIHPSNGRTLSAIAETLDRAQLTVIDATSSPQR
ncbi:MAG: 2-amino-4-hydroxy-6-hydroxymethyldihydropteridine diphosphokinase [Caldilineaceae bacterium]|nr:2-amino-4-hydroxy-6-hydroxymethyldihydropteridine diphosphokinase [Caldilineaceae bacterium]